MSEFRELIERNREYIERNRGQIIKGTTVSEQIEVAEKMLPYGEEAELLTLAILMTWAWNEVADILLEN